MIFYLVLIILLIVFFGICIESYININNFQVDTYDICIPKNKLKFDMKACLLSDLHGNIFEQNNNNLINTIISNNPDIILISGDLVTALDEKSFVVMETFLTRLSNAFYENRKTLNPKIFYGLGNHEEYIFKKNNNYKNRFLSIVNKLSSKGVVFLDNEKFETIINNNSVAIYGLSFGMQIYNKFNKNQIKETTLQEILNNNELKIDNNKFNIVISHHPDTFKLICNYDIDLTVSGHYHGGLVRLPILGGIITPQKTFHRTHTKGVIKYNNKYQIISTGLGWHHIPLRVNNKCQLVFINLKNNM